MEPRAATGARRVPRAWDAQSLGLGPPWTAPTPDRLAGRSGRARAQSGPEVESNVGSEG